MASPAAANGISTTPPTNSTIRPPNANSPSTLQNTPANNATQTSTIGGDASQATNVSSGVNNAPASSKPAQPKLSTQDPGTSKRPRDARLLHLWLGQLGVHAYEERVPLQLMDFAYRYTTGVLADAVALGESGNTAAPGGGRGGGAAAAAAAAEGNVSLYAVKQAIASRVGYQFNPVLPKDWLKELAEERNKVNLPKMDREFGVRLPPERYCLTGTGWGIKDEWESEVEEIEEGVGGDVKMDEDGEKGDVNMEDDEDEFEEVMGVGEDRMETS